MFVYLEAYSFFLQILSNDQVKSIKLAYLWFCKYELFLLTEIKSKKRRKKLFEIHDKTRKNLIMTDFRFKLTVFRNRQICRI